MGLRFWFVNDSTVSNTITGVPAVTMAITVWIKDIAVVNASSLVSPKEAKVEMDK